MSEEKKYPDHVLFQRIEMIFKPAPSWEECLMPLNTHDLLDKIKEANPGFFDEHDQIVDLLEQLHFKYEFNENNQKYYWLVNPVNNF